MEAPNQSRPPALQLGATDLVVKGFRECQKPTKKYPNVIRSVKSGLPGYSADNVRMRVAEL